MRNEPRGGEVRDVKHVPPLNEQFRSRKSVCLAHSMKGAVKAKIKLVIRVTPIVFNNDRTLNNLFTRILAEMEENESFHIRKDKALLLYGRKSIRSRNNQNFRKFNRSPPTNRSPSGNGHRQQTHDGYNQNRSSVPTRNVGTDQRNLRGRSWHKGY